MPIDNMEVSPIVCKCDAFLLVSICVSLTSSNTTVVSQICLQ